MAHDVPSLIGTQTTTSLLPPSQLFPGRILSGVHSWRTIDKVLGSGNQLALMRRLYRRRDGGGERLPLHDLSLAHEHLSRICGQSRPMPLLPRLREEEDFPVGQRVFYCLHYLDDHERLPAMSKVDWIEARIIRQGVMGIKPARLAMRADRPFRHDHSGDHATVGLDRDLIRSAALVSVDDFGALLTCDIRSDLFLRVWFLNVSQEVLSVWGMKLRDYRRILLGGVKERSSSR